MAHFMESGSAVRSPVTRQRVLPSVQLVQFVGLESASD